MNVTTVFNSWTMNYVAVTIPRATLAQIPSVTFHYYDVEGGVKDQALVEKTRKYAEGHIKMFGGEPPDAYTTLAYMAATIMFEAVEKAGSFDVDKVSKVLATGKFQTLKGESYFREDHQLVNQYLAYLVSGKASGTNMWDLYKVEKAFGGEEALPSLKSLGY